MFFNLWKDRYKVRQFSFQLYHLMMTLLFMILVFITQRVRTLDLSFDLKKPSNYDDGSVFVTVMHFYTGRSSLMFEYDTSDEEGNLSPYEIYNYGCYTFKMFHSTFGIGSIYITEPPSYTLYLNNNAISLNNQTYAGTKSFYYALSSTIYFCLDMFNIDEETESTFTTEKDDDDNDDDLLSYLLTIEMTQYPENLILNISQTNANEDGEDVVLYSNSFETTSVATDDDDYYDQTLNFYNISNGCYTITFYDEYFSFFDADLSNRMKYTILINNIVFAYGGYFGEFESTKICTNDTEIMCMTPYYCENKELEYNGNTINTINGHTYKSYYLASITTGDFTSDENYV